MFNAYRVLVRREDILSDLAGAPLRVRLAALFLGTPSMRFEGLSNRGRS
jgi:preflagellin peptidase FlaK